MNELATKKTAELDAMTNTPMGFSEESDEDTAVCRIKVINALSPERTEGTASEGDVINALTGEKLNGLSFIPVSQFYSCIKWNPDRDADTRILCRSANGAIGNTSDGEARSCKSCPDCRFDNTKTGRDAAPKCTKYMNFLGFFRGTQLPVVLSFAKTNYNEGKKMLSIAKSLRESIWNRAYTIDSKEMTKGRNKWYIITSSMEAAPTTAEERQLAFELFKAINTADISVADEDTQGGATVVVDAQVAEEI